MTSACTPLRMALDAIGLELADVPAHPGRLELEHAGRFPGSEELERLIVIERDVLALDRYAPGLLDEAERVFEDGEVPETQEVEFQDAELLELLVLVLRLERVRIALRALERHELGDRLPRDHDSRRVRPRRAH